MASSPNDGYVFRSGAQARVQLTLLQMIADEPGGTYADYAEKRGRATATTGKLIGGFWERGWVRPDRELPAHWSITEKGEEVLRLNAELLA